MTLTNLIDALKEERCLLEDKDTRVSVRIRDEDFLVTGATYDADTDQVILSVSLSGAKCDGNVLLQAL